jgi:hypothetical protein
MYLGNKHIASQSDFRIHQEKKEEQQQVIE